MKKICILIFIFCIFLYFPVHAEENQITPILMEQEDAIQTDSINDALNNIISNDQADIIPKVDMKNLINNISQGKVNFSLKDVLNGMLKFVFNEIYSNFNIIVKVMVLVLLCALLQNLKSSFGKDSVGEIAFYACYILIAAMLIKNFLVVLDMGKTVINNLVIFMQVFIPTIFGLLITTGNVTTAAALQPGVIFSIGVISTLIKNVILPLILFYTVLGIANNLSRKVHITKIADFIKNIGSWSIGILLTIFITVLSFQSTITAVADGIGTKTAKFAVSTFVPVVGKLLSDTVETVVGCSIILKNSLSVVGMLAVVFICLIPILKLFALIIVYKLTAVIIEPISDERIVNCISHMANSLIYISAAVMSVAVMFIISVTILINAGNSAAMLR